MANGVAVYVAERVTSNGTIARLAGVAGCAGGRSPDVARCRSALGSFGEEAKAAIPDLQAAQRDHDVRVRRAAGVALSRIDPQLATKAAPTAGSGK